MATPWVAVVDAGRWYDPFAAQLELHGIPTFRTVDRALRALAVWSAEALRAAPRSQPDLHTAGTDAW
jgi:hypothetical protein